jgi:hypothetical protein
MFRPARRFLTGPRPPADLAARFLAAVILPPLLFFAILKSPLESLFQVLPLLIGRFSFRLTLRAEVQSATPTEPKIVPQLCKTSWAKSRWRRHVWYTSLRRIDESQRSLAFQYDVASGPNNNDSSTTNTRKLRNVKAC